ILQVDLVVERRDVRGRLDRKRPDALENRRDRRERAVRDVRRVRCVLDVTNRGVEALNLRFQGDGDTETRRVIGRGVDAKAARELLDEISEAPLSLVEVEEGGIRKQVVRYRNAADAVRHRVPPLILAYRYPCNSQVRQPSDRL